MILFKLWLLIFAQYVILDILPNKKEQNVCIDTNLIWHFKGNHSKAKFQGGSESYSNWYDEFT